MRWKDVCLLSKDSELLLSHCDNCSVANGTSALLQGINRYIVVSARFYSKHDRGTLIYVIRLRVGLHFCARVR